MHPQHLHSQAAQHGHGPVEHTLLTGIKYASYAAAAVSLLPFVLQLGADPGGAADSAFDWATARCATPSPGTWAKSFAAFLSPIPLIGLTLASAGIGAVSIAAAVGIGGTLLGRYLEKKGTTIDGIPIGKVIRWAALGTSMLFAMPAILSGISMGLHFLSAYLPFEFGQAFASGEGNINGTISGWANTVGSVGTIGAVDNAAGAIGVAATHGIVCGLPALMAGKLSHSKLPDTKILASANSMREPMMHGKFPNAKYA